QPAVAVVPSSPAVEPVTEPETFEEVETIESVVAETPAAPANPYGWQFVAPKAPTPVEEPAEEPVPAEQPVSTFEPEPADPADDYVVLAVADETPEAQPETTVEPAPAVAYDETPAMEETDPIAEPPLAEPASEMSVDDVLTEEPDPVAYSAEDVLSDSDEDEVDERTDARAAVADDEMTVADYKLAARFSLCGNISRKMKTVKVSSDVGRLAQLMHPGESLSTIVENALLSRIYVENRDAFDALAEMIEKKGGHIKC
ncbi:MAG: hypothetical protein J6R04_04630, partial [Clostridia bacterium]|nr:hypothetical protein [Clostridia bacterium]